MTYAELSIADSIQRAREQKARQEPPPPRQSSAGKFFNFELFTKRESAKNAALDDGQPGGLAELQQRLRECLARRRTYLDLQQTAGDIARQIDLAVEKHAAATEPIQAQLAADDLPGNERIELRKKILAANAALESEIVGLRGQLAAAQEEMSLLASRGVDPALVEAAAVKSASKADTERMKILAKADELLHNGVLFSLSKKAADARQYASDVKARELATKHPEYGEIESTDAMARLAEGAHSVLAKFGLEITRERDAIRKRIIAALYEGIAE